MTPIPIQVAEYEGLARERMERGAFDFYAGGAEDERTLEANRRAFDRVVFHPRVLVDVSRIDLSIELVGERLATPILIAPTALHGLAHPEGEVATARGAAAANTLMVASTVSSRTLEDVAAASAAPKWFQLYCYSDRRITRGLVERATAAGYRAIVLTVDLPFLGRRERDLRNQFELPVAVRLANLEAAHRHLSETDPTYRPPEVEGRVQQFSDASLTWEVIAWLRSITPLPILIKGVMAPADASLALEAGVDGIIVSNHGGRQLDGTQASLLALPGIAATVDGRMPVLMDGGIRRGTDVLKALALGADAVLIGRACLWGLAAAGEEGVAHVLELLRSELELSMALAGRTRIDAIDRSLVTLS